MRVDHAIAKLSAIDPDFLEHEVLAFIRDNYKAYCPKCGSILSYADYHLSNDDYLGACLECDEDFYAIECELEEDPKC